MCDIRIGHGYDVHRVDSDRKLVLGGVEIPCEYGLLGHSDADVLIHALMDALLGAAGLGDIGRHFPDTAEEYRGISSIKLLERVVSMLRDNGYTVCNVDMTLVAQKPKISPYVGKMVGNVAVALNIAEDRVNIKATTEEGLGFTGNMQGMSAYAVALIEKK